MATAAFTAIGPRAWADDNSQQSLSGAIIKWIVPYRPGGGYDEYSRLIAPVLEKRTGARIDLVNLPGGGGMRGAAELFRAPADGLHMGLVNGSGLLANSLTKTKQENWSFARFSFIGRIAAEPRVLIVNAKGNFKDFAALKNAERSVICGATGIGGTTYLDASIAGRVFDLDQTIIHGFDNSADIRLALLRGDVDCMWGSLGSAYDGLRSGDFRAVLTKAPVNEPLLEETPDGETAAGDILDDPRKRALFDAWLTLSQMGRVVVGPPGISDEKLMLLRSALTDALADPELKAAAQKANRQLSPLSGAEAALMATRFAEIDEQTRASIEAMVRGEI